MLFRGGSRVDGTPLFSLRENPVAKEPGPSYPERWRCASWLGASLVLARRFMRPEDAVLTLRTGERTTPSTEGGRGDDLAAFRPALPYRRTHAAIVGNQ